MNLNVGQTLDNLVAINVFPYLLSWSGSRTTAWPPVDVARPFNSYSLPHLPSVVPSDETSVIVDHQPLLKCSNIQTSSFISPGAFLSRKTKAVWSTERLAYSILLIGNVDSATHIYIFRLIGMQLRIGV